MRIAGVIENDVANGIDGISVSVWLQGCPHRCVGCHNPHTWDPDGGEYVEFNSLLERVKMLLNANGVHRNLSILGGEPLSDENCIYTETLAKMAKKEGSNVIVWTGYTLKELIKSYKVIYMDNIDYLIDGRFDYTKYNPSLKFRGSSNQRIYKKVKRRIFKGYRFVDITDSLDRLD